MSDTASLTLPKARSRSRARRRRRPPGNPVALVMAFAALVWTWLDVSVWHAGLVVTTSIWSIATGCLWRCAWALWRNQPLEAARFLVWSCVVGLCAMPPAVIPV